MISIAVELSKLRNPPILKNNNLLANLKRLFLFGIKDLRIVKYIL